MKVLKNKKSGEITNCTRQKHGSLKSAGIRIAEHFRKNGGFGMNELLGIAAVLIIAAFVIIPGLRTLAGDIMKKLQDWWADSIVGKIFTTG